MLMAYAMQQEQQRTAEAPRGAEIRIEGISFHPPGSEKPLLQHIDMTLPANSLGLVMGRSGSGKTTLLQVLAGLTEQSSGHVRLMRGGEVMSSGGLVLGQQNVLDSVAMHGRVAAAAASGGVPTPVAALTVEERMQQVGGLYS